MAGGRTRVADPLEWDAWRHVRDEHADAAVVAVTALDGLRSLTREDHATRTRGHVVAVLAIVVLGGLVPLAIASHFGAFGIPRNDDWAYVHALTVLDARAALDGGHWVSANLVGQLVGSLPLVWIFGTSIRALQVWSVLVGVVGLLAVHDLAGRRTTPTRALLVTLVVAVGPLWATLSVSYMTDVPAFTFAMVCLALGVRGIRADGPRATFFASLVVGVLAFTVREYAVAAPFAVAVTALWCARDWPETQRRAVRWTCAGAAAAIGLFYYWRLHIPTWFESSVGLPGLDRTTAVVDDFAQATMLVGLLVLPVTVLARPRRALLASFRRAPQASVVTLTTVSIFLAAAIGYHGTSGVFTGGGNYVTSLGALGTSTLRGDRGLVLPWPVMVTLAVAGAWSALVLCALAVPAVADTWASFRRRAALTPVTIPQVVVGLALLAYLVPYVVSSAFGIGVYDRYLLPVVPLAAILVLWRAPRPGPSDRRRMQAASVAFVVLALLGLVIAVNAASFDGTKWKVATRAAEVTGDGELVDGGYEWIGAHGLFLDRGDPCVRLESSPSEPETSPEMLATEPVWGLGGPQTWITARYVADHC